MHNVNWDDLRFALAVAEEGTVSAAARRLGVNHATVVRRVAALEDRLGIAIFDKSPLGYRIPEDRARVINALQEVETATISVERVAQRARDPARNHISVTSTDTLCSTLLPPVMRDIANAQPGLNVRILCSNRHLDLARMDADIAVRPALRLDDDLAGEKAGDLDFRVFGAPDGSRDWIGMTGNIAGARPALWMAEHVPPSQMAAWGDSFLTLAEMAALGQGQVVLPSYLGDGDTRLIRLQTPMPDFSVPVWVASHSDLADVPRLKALRAAICKGLGAGLAQAP